MTAHLAGRSDALVSVTPVLERGPLFDDLLADLLEMSLEEQMDMQDFETKSIKGGPLDPPISSRRWKQNSAAVFSAESHGGRRERKTMKQDNADHVPVM